MGVMHFLNVRPGDCSIIQHASGRVTIVGVCKARSPKPQTICADRADAKRELVDDVIDKIKGIRLRVAAIDFKCASAGRVIDGRLLEAPDLLSTFFPEGQEFNVNLNRMAGSLFMVAFGRDLSYARPTRETVEAMPFQDAVNAYI